MALGSKLDAFFARYKYEYFGIAAVAITAGCMLVSALGFPGYSVLNHVVSELGMASESPWAAIFNGGLIAGGILFFVFLWGTRTVMNSRLANLGRHVGYIAAIGCSLVGVFPFDVNLWGHIISSQMYFIGGLLAVLALSLAIWRQKEVKIGKWLSLVGVIVMGIFATFVIMLEVTMTSATAQSSLSGLYSMNIGLRPEFMVIAFFEWLDIIGIIAWMCLFALESLRKRR